jgi:hypothetical protein
MAERIEAADAPPPPPPPPLDNGPRDRNPDVTPELSDALGRDDQGSDARQPGGGADQQRQVDPPAAPSADVPAGPTGPGTREQAPDQDLSRPEAEKPGLPRADVRDELRSAMAEPDAQPPGSADDRRASAGQAAVGTQPEAAADGPASPVDTGDAVRDRKTWEVNPDGSELPPSMKEDLQGIGKSLAETADPGDWAKADIDTRREMLDTANHRIREEYGLPQRDVSYRSDMDPDVYGEYDPRTGDISVNSSLLEADHPEEAIKTLAHENFHHYQQQAIDGHPADPYAQSRANDWIEGDTNYDSNDFMAYMNNPLEADAYAVEEEVYRGYKGG